ncbi:superoxide dismutase [Caerostris darwini]|uniref:Superoxide dismutase [Cu-Zn] n=1 Tax=Caerostris darwini TaxID=1538125 RepID=A0AAV4MCN1_9ARAC|nr:superoxide dismutase [Caerostris darwini]
MRLSTAWAKTNTFDSFMTQSKHLLEGEAGEGGGQLGKGQLRHLEEDRFAPTLQSPLIPLPPANARYLYWSRGAPSFISNMFLLVFSCVILLSGALGVRAAQPIAPRQSLPDCERAAAVCRLHNGTVTATINFKRERVTAPVTVSGEISGLAQGLHGFHVHQYGDLSQGCVSAGPHFNPYGRNHGAPDVEERHVGDLGNIQAGPDGVARFQIVDHQLRLCGPLSIMGRAIVVHAMQDDLGRGGNEESLKTGNAGPRLGCCVIGQASL